MKKKLIKLLLIFALVLCTVSVPVFAIDYIKATKTNSTISVNGVNKSFDAYNINGNNYFKLRDIAYVLNKTDKQFEVKWDNINQKISIITNHTYTPAGGELSNKNNLYIQNAVSTTSEVYLDNQKIILSSYNIDGNNYFKLRDLGEKINFGVLWNDKTQTIQIYSTCGYSKETPTTYTYVKEAIDPWSYIKMLGKGMDVDWSKTNDGRKYYNEQTVKDFKEAGVSHVRIRISDKATDELMQNLDKQINDCLKNGMIPIIAYQADEFKNEPNEKNIQAVINWWSTIANRYKDYSHLLSFDLLIEATDALNQQPEKLNEIYDRLVTEVRKTNPSRIIMISPRLRSDAEYLKELKIPTNHNGYLMAEWHFYASGPSKDNDRKLWTIGTDEEKKLIDDKINEALLWQKQTGIPTWIGAWMPGNYNDGNDYSIKEQAIFANYMTTQLFQSKIPFAVNSDTKYYDRENNKWITEMLPVFNAIFRAHLNDVSSANQTIENKDITNNKSINVGFNAKGNLFSKEQCSYLQQELEKLKKDKIKTEKLWIRLQGGTSSQKTYPSDWSDETINQWVEIQKSFGCKYIFVVNFNDTPENQLAFYKRLIAKGIDFNFIELGNEHYLSKFALSKTKEAEEVTKRTSNMTPEKYISMCEEYIKTFNSLKLPFYIQFAPEKEDKTNTENWNNVIVKAINTNYFSSKEINGSIHLYERNGDGSLNEKQINKIKILINHPINIAITESGVIDNGGKLSYKELIKQENNLTTRLLNQLENGDLLVNQVLYTDYKEVGLAAFHSQYGGITPKGEDIFKIFRNYLK